jgi:ABC-type oligopeptide transport system ATPase subunit
MALVEVNAVSKSYPRIRVLTIATEPLMMERGRMVERRETEAVRAHLRETCVQQLIATTPELPLNAS